MPTFLSQIQNDYISTKIIDIFTSIHYYYVTCFLNGHQFYPDIKVLECNYLFNVNLGGAGRVKGASDGWIFTAA